VSKTLSLVGQRTRLGLRRRHALDLVELEGEQIELALASVRHRTQLGDTVLEPAHPHVPLPHPRPQRRDLGAAPPVEHVQLNRREHQPAVLVLPVEGQQHAPELSQVGHRGRAPAHVGAGPAVRPYAPGQHELLGAVGNQLELAQLGR
jgi:hypothetical protein